MRSVAQSDAAPKKVVTTAQDLPRFTYPATSASALLQADDATFKAFVEKVDGDVRSTLATYQIEDKATLRQLLTERANAALLMNDIPGGFAVLDRLKSVEEKPSALATSGIMNREILLARQDSGASFGPAYQQAFAARFQQRLAALPWSAGQDEAKGLKRLFEILGPQQVISVTRAEEDPGVAKTSSMTFEVALRIIQERVLLQTYLPLSQPALRALNTYIAANNQQKPDIWAAREVTLSSADRLTPVRIGIWDSGVDTSLFPAQLYPDTAPAPFNTHGLPFDQQGKLAAGDLQPLTPEQKSDYPKVLKLSKGLDDLQNGIDSPDAIAARALLTTTPPDELARFRKSYTFLNQWSHGTHVAGIAARGNPAAQLVVLQFDDGLATLPFAPSVAWAAQFKTDFAMLAGYLNTHQVRVVNMSWSDNQGEFEQWLAKTSTEKDPQVRKQTAAKLYAIWREAVEGAIRKAPGTLFVCAAGNADSNAGFLGDVPASLHLPNLVTVGAVDQAGEETSFTSYGDTVILDANGFQVDSYMPGGSHARKSGTSMASPNVANLAAKLIALNPALTPEQTIALIKQGAETSADGRRHLINPKASVALLQRASNVSRPIQNAKRSLR